MSEETGQSQLEKTKHSFQSSFMIVFVFAFLVAEMLIYIQIVFDPLTGLWFLVLDLLAVLGMTMIAMRLSGKEYDAAVPLSVSIIAVLVVAIRANGMDFPFVPLLGIVGFALGAFCIGAYEVFSSLSEKLRKKATANGPTKRFVASVILFPAVIVIIMIVVNPYIPSMIEYLDLHQGATSFISAILAALLGVLGGWLLGKKGRSKQ